MDLAQDEHQLTSEDSAEATVSFSTYQPATGRNPKGCFETMGDH